MQDEKNKAPGNTVSILADGCVLSGALFFKYAVKFSDLSPADNWHAAQIFKGKRLLGSFGLFRGVDVPEELMDTPLDDLPYVDRFYRFLQGNYQFSGESPRSSS